MDRHGNGKDISHDVSKEVKDMLLSEYISPNSCAGSLNLGGAACRRCGLVLLQEGLIGWGCLLTSSDM